MNIIKKYIEIEVEYYVTLMNINLLKYEFIKV